MVPANVIRIVEALADGDTDLAEALIENADLAEVAAPAEHRCPSCARWPGQRWDCIRCSIEPVELEVAA